MISNAVNLEAGGLLRSGWGDVKRISIAEADRLGLRVSVLEAVTVSVAQEGDLNVSSLSALLRIVEDAIASKPSSIQGAGDLEDTTLLTLGVVDNPALSLAAVIAGGSADGHSVAVSRVGQSNSSGLKDEVTTLGEVADDFLEAIFEEERLSQVLRAVWHSGSWRSVRSLAEGGTNPVSECILRRLRGNRNFRNGVVGLYDKINRQDFSIVGTTLDLRAQGRVR